MKIYRLMVVSSELRKASASGADFWCCGSEAGWPSTKGVIGTFRTRLTLEVDEPHGRAVGPHRFTQQYLPHQNERFYRDSMGDAYSRGRSIALQSWW